MTCKDICIRHRAQKPLATGRYANGQKRCQICELYMRWDSLFCPCCGYRLRTKPRSLKYKIKLRTRKRVEEKQDVRRSLSSMQYIQSTSTSSERIENRF